ncbi:MAG: hypothetical protein Q9217_003364 [Psora testacea]
MVVLNAALLSLLLPAAVLARPNAHERLHHKNAGGPTSLFDNVKPSGIHGGPPIQSGGSVAPFPAGNQTHGAATASSGPVTIQSTVSIIPIPSAGGYGKSGGAGGAGQTDSPTQSGAPGGGAGGPGQSGSPIQSGAPGGGGSEFLDNKAVCGAATVTVTSANTITVTAPGAGGQAQSSPTVSKGPGEGVVEGKSNGAPYNESPKSSSTATTAAAGQVQSSPPATPQGPGEDAVKEKSNSIPYSEAPKTSTASTAAPEQESTTPEKPPVQEKYVEKPSSTPEYQSHSPQQSPVQYQQKTKENQEKPSSQAPPKASQVPSSTNQAPASTSSSPPPQSSTTSKSSGGNVKAKGILYATLDEANAMTGMGWGCNWDSSPKPAVGLASGTLNYEFVPQLHGPDEVHTSIWARNSANYPYVMAFNEPNIEKSLGGCGPMSPGDAVGPYESHMKANKDAGQKIVSPCVSNNEPKWLDTFIGSTSLKPDAVCFHWYGETLEQLKSVVLEFQKLQKDHGIAELWMTEWAFNVKISTKDMQEVLTYLDGAGLTRYAYNALKFVPAIKAAYLS